MTTLEEWDQADEMVIETEASRGDYEGGLNIQAAELLKQVGLSLPFLVFGKQLARGRGYGGAKIEASVLGAHETDENFKEVVAVGDDSGYWASGIHIGDGYVLTAGHVDALGGRRRVSSKSPLGADQVCNREIGACKVEDGEYEVVRSVRHPGFWNDPFYSHDLALLRLKTEPSLSIPRHATANEFRDAKVGLVVGYGGDDSHGQGGKGGNKPTAYGARRMALVPILHEWMIARERYFHRYWGYESRYEFVATSPLKEADACVGDSGGGFYIPICPDRKGTPDHEEDGSPLDFICRHGQDVIPSDEAHIKWKLAGMVSRQFGLGGNRCGAGSIYLKLFWGPSEGEVGEGPDRCSQNDPPKADSDKRDQEELRDEGAEYYEECVEAMKKHLSADGTSESELIEGCMPCRRRHQREEREQQDGNE